MKPFFVFTVLFICTAMIACTAPNKTVQHNCQPVTDSASLFVQTNGFTLNTRPSSPDPERNLQLDEWLQKRSYSELACLLNNEDVNLKYTGFTYASVLYPDSLQKYYASLLQDATPVQFINADGSTSNRSTLGEILSAVSAKLHKGITNTNKVPAVEKIIPPFIQQYAAYPDSYKPATYTGQFAKEDSASDFIVKHTYALKNNKGVPADVTHVFLINSRLVITAIKNESGENKLAWWLKEFGRKLNRSDSVALGL